MLVVVPAAVDALERERGVDARELSVGLRFFRKRGSPGETGVFRTARAVGTGSLAVAAAYDGGPAVEIAGARRAAALPALAAATARS